jgi:polar amino acid transport system substrate-binding protein
MSMNTARALSTIVVAAVAIVLAGCAASPSGGGGDEPSNELGLVEPGTLTICANLETPPNIYAEADGTPVGVEVEIADAMAEVMDLTPSFQPMAFAGLIPALQAKQCDTIISTLYIKPEREEIANFVPYLISGSGVAVSKANPAGITGYDDTLCGVSAVAITGATGADLLQEQSDACVADGKEPIEISLTDKAADALQQVIAGQIDAFMDTSELMAFYEQESDGEFVSVGDPVGKINIGAASLKGNDALRDALLEAFDAIVEDGTYASILEKWNFQDLDIANAE